MEDSRIVIRGTKHTVEEYELRYVMKGNPHCYTGFPCDKDGNLIMDRADVWGNEYLLIKDSDYWEGPEIVHLVHERIGRSLIKCNCGEAFLDMPDGRGRIIGPRCKCHYDGEGRPKKHEGFHIVKEEGYENNVSLPAVAIW